MNRKKFFEEPSQRKSQSIFQIRPRQSNIYGILNEIGKRFTSNLGISRRRSVVEDDELEGGDVRRNTQQLLTMKRRGEGWSHGLARGRFWRNKRIRQIKG